MAQKIITKNSASHTLSFEESATRVKDTLSYAHGQLLGLNDGFQYRLGVCIDNASVLILFEKKLGVKYEAFSKIEEAIAKNHIKLGEIKSEHKRGLAKLAKENKIHKYTCNILTSYPHDRLGYIKLLKDNCARMQYFKKGDIIGFDRKFYTHTAILVDENTFEIIHRNGEPKAEISFLKEIVPTVSGVLFEKAIVRKDFLIDIMKLSVVTTKNEQFESVYAPKSPNEIVQRAENKLGEVGYNLLAQNCQHFATYCRYGVEKSHEIEKTVSTGVLVAGTTLVTSILGFYLHRKTVNRRK